LDSIILTSATLKLQNSFNYFSEELGLASSGNVLFEKVLPAFDFSNQARIFIAGDLPEPEWERDGVLIEACADAVTKVTQSCSGNVLALFTSHRHLLKTYHSIKAELEHQGIRVLAHDIDGDRYNLVQAMKTDKKTLLLGTGSFWEGIDVPGDCLQCVVICKLPFPVPDSPLFEAKVERARQQGRNPFTSIFLPVCTARLLQGIGRLIRSENDFGFAVILDGRLISKSYSGFILDSLPDAALTMETDSICETIEEMIAIRKTSPPGYETNTMIGD
jgi:ATP-dependent DNA helicase DinG